MYMSPLGISPSSLPSRLYTLGCGQAQAGRVGAHAARVGAGSIAGACTPAAKRSQRKPGGGHQLPASRDSQPGARVLFCNAGPAGALCAPPTLQPGCTR